jgi:hypothetical protein
VTTPPAAAAPPVKTVRILQPAAITKAIGAGVARLTLPILLLLGISALGGALYRKPGTRGDPDEPLPTEDPVAAAEVAAESDPNPNLSSRGRASVFDPW